MTPTKANLSVQPVALMTGGNTGIGRVCALELAKSGFRVFIACRDERKARLVIEECCTLKLSGSIEFISLDLADFKSVRLCVKTYLSKNIPLHLLINNAGVAGAKGQTAQGFELTMGINHLGHFLLTQELLPILQASAPARIVNLASRAHFYASGIDFDRISEPSRSRFGIKEYCESKLANILFTKELAHKLRGTGVSVYAVHPGVVASDLWREVNPALRWVMKLFMISNEEGAKTSLYCATSEDVCTESGFYYAASGQKRPSRVARDPTLAAEFWRRSQEWINSQTE
jgi:NAD(P)-dependent dehydrogenase (short-subunit alcohol dehydrogenase family)